MVGRGGVLGLADRAAREYAIEGEPSVVGRRVGVGALMF